MRLASVLIIFVVSAPSSINAQQSGENAQASAGPRFYVAGGVELARVIHYPGPYSLAYGQGLGLSLQAGVTWQSDRLGLRLGLGYYERDREYDYSAGFGSFPEFNHSAHSSTLAANVDLTYDLTRSRIRPYVIGGLALYRASVTNRYDSGQTTRFSNLGIALTPGLGLRVPLRHAEAFAETRFQLFSGHSHVVWPLTFGIRF